MDGETKAYLDAMMVQLNDKSERILDEIGMLRSDFQNTKGFLLEDAIVMGRRTLTIEQRLAQTGEAAKGGLTLGSVRERPHRSVPTERCQLIEAMRHRWLPLVVDIINLRAMT